MAVRVFLSWSGDRSRAVATALKDWLPVLLQYVEPWLSTTDIHAGERWGQSVARELSESNFGVLCVTPENLASPWILFEAGALAKSLDSSVVVPMLLDLDLADLTGPLAQFQAQKLTREGVRSVLDSIQHIAPEPVDLGRLERGFEAAWPTIEQTLAEIEPLGEPSPKRPVDEVLEDLVTRVRAIDVASQGSEQRIVRTIERHSATPPSYERPLSLRISDLTAELDSLKEQQRLQEEAWRTQREELDARRREEFGEHYPVWEALGRALSSGFVGMEDTWRDREQRILGAFGQIGDGPGREEERQIDALLRANGLALNIDYVSPEDGSLSHSTLLDGRGTDRSTDG